MKKSVFFFILSIFFQFSALSQPCLPSGITFNTQAEIDSFQFHYPNCNQIEGWVTINGSGITNLNGLSVLYSLRDLEISNTSLTSLTGLNNVTYIFNGIEINNNDVLTTLTGLDNLISLGSGGQLEIRNNDSLVNLSGLENITVIDSWLEIENNKSLISLTGLDNILSIRGHVRIINNISLTNIDALDNISSISFYCWITDNHSLNSLSGLKNVTKVDGELEIINNNSLVSLNGLNKLTHAREYFIIEDNNSLTSLNGLANLTYIEDYLHIGNNNSLKSLDGLENLSSIGDGLHIYNNDSLISITGLQNLNSIDGHLWIENNIRLASLLGLDNINENTITHLYIYNNYSLSDCEAHSVCEYLASPNGTININSNAKGCNTQSEVDSACSSDICTIYGNVSYDDTLTPSQPIINTKLILHNVVGVVVDSTITDQNGNYQFNNVYKGTFYIQTICTKAWGGGGASDALRVMRHFVGLNTMAGLPLKAADTDASGFVNTNDALVIAQRMVFMLNYYPSGDWIFEEDHITVNGANVLHDIKGLCFGDVGASYVVPFK